MLLPLLRQSTLVTDTNHVPRDMINADRKGRYHTRHSSGDGSAVWGEARNSQTDRQTNGHTDKHAHTHTHTDTRQKDKLRTYGHFTCVYYEYPGKPKVQQAWWPRGWTNETKAKAIWKCHTTFDLFPEISWSRS